MVQRAFGPKSKNLTRSALIFPVKFTNIRISINFNIPRTDIIDNIVNTAA